MKGMAWRATTVASGLALAGIAVLATDAIGLTDVHPVLMNRSDSLPRGLYLRTLEPIALGSIVAMPTPPVILPYLEAVSPEWAKWFERHPLPCQTVARCQRGPAASASAKTKSLSLATLQTVWTAGSMDRCQLRRHRCIGR
jgi:hypothetical protein